MNFEIKYSLFFFFSNLSLINKYITMKHNTTNEQTNYNVLWLRIFQKFYYVTWRVFFSVVYTGLWWSTLSSDTSATVSDFNDTISFLAWFWFSALVAFTNSGTAALVNFLFNQMLSSWARVGTTVALV